MNKKEVLKNTGKVIGAIISAVVLFFITIFCWVLLAFGSVHADFYSDILITAAVLIEIGIIGTLWGWIKKKFFYIPLCAALGICIIVCCVFSGYQNYIDNIPTVGENDNLLASYAPYAENSKTVTLGEESDLILTENLPVMDGATALYPVYSAFAKAVYPQKELENVMVYAWGTSQHSESAYLRCYTTTGAYENIISGENDIIFAALPSEKQKKAAEEKGVELIYTPIGKEAFVFFVNAKNPIDNITVDEIQKIYSGEITDWSELGIQNLGQIRAFQRDEGSGSQSTLEKLMEGKNLITPPKENVIAGMGGIIERAADYKNYKNAIGYSFRFYSTEMVQNSQIKLLSVNGVYPNLENIKNGTYPLASYFYAVTRSDADENVLKLLEWIKGEQGQKIIEMTGYAPLDK